MDLEQRQPPGRWRLRRISGLLGAVTLVALLVGMAPSIASAGADGTAASGTSRYTFLAGVSCTGKADCMAVGASTSATGGGRTLAERWNGTTWRIIPTFDLGGARSTNRLSSVSCVSPISCSAVGSAFGGRTPVAEQWNGAAWSLVRAPLPSGAGNGSLESVSCTTPSDCTAVGSINDNSGLPPANLIEHWNGLRWSVVPGPDPAGATVSNLWAVSCRAGAGCTAVGDSAAGPGTETTLVEHGVGSSWVVVPSPGVPGAQTSLQAVDCVSASRCTAGGYIYRTGPNGLTGSTLVEREVDGTWSTVSSPDPVGTSYDGFGGVSCVSASRCLGAGSAQSPTGVATLVEQGTGSRWTIAPTADDSGPLNAFGGISCPSPTSCMAVGDHDPGDGTRLPLAEQWDGSTWVIVATPNP